jgi:hypothetical protein
MKELRTAIKKALETVTPQNAPTVYNTIQSEQGYKTIEDMIIHMMVNDNITASACIPYIEEQL